MFQPTPRDFAFMRIPALLQMLCLCYILCRSLLPCYDPVVCSSVQNASHLLQESNPAGTCPRLSGGLVLLNTTHDNVVRTPACNQQQRLEAYDTLETGY